MLRGGEREGGFSVARSHPFTGPEGVSLGGSRLIPWTGPRLAPLISNGCPSGEWVGQGALAGDPEETRHGGP